MENRKTVLVRYQFSSFNGACIYDLASGRKLTKLSLSLSLAQLSPILSLIFLVGLFSEICEKHTNPLKGNRPIKFQFNYNEKFQISSNLTFKHSFICSWHEKLLPNIVSVTFLHTLWVMLLFIFNLIKCSE